MKNLKFLAMAALLVLPLAACDEGESVAPANGTVRGTVLVDGEGLGGVTVTLSGATSQTATTDGSGNYQFTGVAEGTYAVSISGFPADVTFPQTAQTVTVTGSGTATADFSGEFIRTSSISGTVSAGGSGVEGATVQLSGDESRTATTDAGGAYAFSGLAAGNYTVTISGLPDEVDCATTQNSVTLTAGQAEIVSFSCDRGVQATVAITSITTVNTNQPVDPNNVSGQIDVTLNVEPNGDDITEVELRIDGDSVAAQSFSSTAPGAESAAGAAEFPVIFSIDTEEFDEETGEPLYLNEDHTITAVVTTAQGGTEEATASTTLEFNNSDTFVLQSITTTSEPMSAVGENGTAAAGQGLLWYGGDLTANVLFVSYSGQTLGNAQAALTGTGGGAPDDVTIDGNTAAFTWEGFTTDPADLPDGNDIVINSALTQEGEAVDDLPETVQENIRIDNTAPDPGVLEVNDLRALFGDPLDSGPGECCGDNWVNSGYEWSTDHQGFEDVHSGVATDLSGVAYHQGAAADIDLMTYADFAAGATPGDAGIEPSDQHTDYSTVAEVCDVVGNCAAVQLAGDGGVNPLTSFGVDDGLPTGELLATSVQHMDMFNAMNAFAGEDFEATASDTGGEEGGPAGFLAGYQLYGTLTQFDAVDGETCLIGDQDSPDCAVRDLPRMALTGLPADGGTGNEAYFILDAAPGDQAGNIGESLTPEGGLWVVIDATLPMVSTTGTNPTESQLAGGGTYTWTRDFEENLDADSYFHTWSYGALGVQIRHSDATTDLGPTFDMDLVTEGTVEATTDFLVRRLDTTLPLITDQATPGVPQTADNYVPGPLNLHVQDAAGNLGSLGVAPPPVEAGTAIATDLAGVLNEFFFDHLGETVEDGEALTLTAVMEGTNALTNPCTHAMDFHVLDPNGHQRFIGTASSRLEDIDVNTRRVVFEFDWTVDGELVQGWDGVNPVNAVFGAFCTDASGDALITLTDAITVEPATP